MQNPQTHAENAKSADARGSLVGIEPSTRNEPFLLIGTPSGRPDLASRGCSTKNPGRLSEEPYCLTERSVCLRVAARQRRASVFVRADAFGSTATEV